MGQPEVKDAPGPRRGLNKTVRVSAKALRGDRWHIHRISNLARAEQKRVEIWHFLGLEQDFAHLERNTDCALRQPADTRIAQSTQD